MEKSCRNCVHNPVCASYTKVCQILFGRNSHFNNQGESTEVIQALGNACKRFFSFDSVFERKENV